MYQVEIEVVLLGHDGMMGLSRTLELPFVPAPGMGLYGLTTKCDRWETVEAVAWDVAAGRFHVELVDCESPEESIAELIDYYGPDWELREPGCAPVEET